MRSCRVLRQKWRQAERRWKKDKLQVSFEILRDCMITYQQFVKSTKSQYFSVVISDNLHCPRVLFRVINTVLNMTTPAIVDNTNFFVDKITVARANIHSFVLNPASPLVQPDSCTTAQLCMFEPVSLFNLLEVMQHLKACFMLLRRIDGVPPQTLLRRREPLRRSSTCTSKKL